MQAITSGAFLRVIAVALAGGLVSRVTALAVISLVPPVGGEAGEVGITIAATAGSVLGILDVLATRRRAITRVAFFPGETSGHLRRGAREYGGGGGGGGDDRNDRDRAIL